MPRSVAADHTRSNSGWFGGIPFAGSDDTRKARLPRSRIRVSSATTQSRSSNRNEVTGWIRLEHADACSTIHVLTASSARCPRPGSEIARASV